MNNIVVALPDGDGCFGTEEFWKNYLDAIGCRYYDKQIPLSDLYNKSNMVFPKNICLNSKYRLGRALFLSDKATHFVMFLRDDPFVSNCPSSVYRINWIRDYFKNINVITWKSNLIQEGTDVDNLIELASRLGADAKDAENFIKTYGLKELPRRKTLYDFSLNKIDSYKKTVLLIGVVPHLIDKYRKSRIMDYMISRVNIIDPMSYDSNDMLFPKSINETVFYKDNAILNSCDYFINNNLIDGIIFVSDPFDIPGKFSFPKYQFYLQSKGIYEYKGEKNKKLSYINITVNIHNQDSSIKKLDDYFNNI